MTVEIPERFKGTVWWQANAREPRAVAFREGLERIEKATEQMLCEQILLLPPAIQTRLAKGPSRRRYDCGVCEAFGHDWVKEAPCDPEDPCWWVWAYHEVPKLDARRSDDQWDGPIANRIYERTIATYRAAGWKGEAAEANA